MSFLYSEKMLEALKRVAGDVREEEVMAVLSLMRDSERIFCDGMGRSGLCAKGFAMRLMQMGRQAFVVGETVTPAIGKHDLLLICSGSGETPVLRLHVEQAQRSGAKTAVITACGTSYMAAASDACIVLNASAGQPSGRSCGIQSDVTSGSGEKDYLPMGTLFEASCSFLLDNLAAALMKDLGETGQSMRKRHANLE